MTLCDFTTSYVQRPFAMQMPYYTSTFQTPLFNVPLFGTYNSMLSTFPKMPIMSVFDYSTFGYTPTIGSCYLGQTGINPPYNVYPYPINTMPRVVTVPKSTPQYNFGSLTTNYNKKQEYNFNFGDMSHILTKPTTTSSSSWTFSQNVGSSGKKPTVSRALELAVAELGTSENNGSNDSAGIRKYKNGAMNNLPWCASFASWLYGAGQGGSNSKTFGYSMHSQTIRRRAANAGFYASKNSGYKPKPGDLMIMKYTDNSGHVGIVTNVYADGSFDTIEGNQSNKVQKVHRTMDMAQLDGFVRMEDWLQAA